jgi:hypothetical protein
MYCILFLDIYGRKGVICQFASPLSDDIHTRPEVYFLLAKNKLFEIGPSRSVSFGLEVYLH